MVLQPTARWMLALLTSIGLQVCCCNVKTLLGGCCQGGRSETTLSMAIGDRHHDSHHHHGSDDGGGPCDSIHHPLKDHGPPAAPCGPCDHHNGGCACGTHDKAPSLVVKTSAAIPAMGVVILAPPVILASPLTIGATRCAGLHAVLLPPTSLLRQHCALIV
jgi:hypothetical protein